MEKKLVPEVVSTIYDTHVAYSFLNSVYSSLNRGGKKVKLSDFLKSMDREINGVLGAFRDRDNIDPNTEIAQRNTYYDSAMEIIVYRPETSEEESKRKKKAEKEKVRRKKEKEKALQYKIEQYKKLEKELKLAGKI